MDNNFDLLLPKWKDYVILIFKECSHIIFSKRFQGVRASANGLKTFSK